MHLHLATVRSFAPHWLGLHGALNVVRVWRCCRSRRHGDGSALLKRQRRVSEPCRMPALPPQCRRIKSPVAAYSHSSLPCRSIAIIEEAFRIVRVRIVGNRVRGEAADDGQRERTRYDRIHDHLLLLVGKTIAGIWDRCWRNAGFLSKV